MRLSGNRPETLRKLSAKFFFSSRIVAKLLVFDIFFIHTYFYNSKNWSIKSEYVTGQFGNPPNQLMLKFQLKSCALGVSSKDIQKARQNAKRSRTAVACSRCKAGKTKCSEFRPCKQCVVSRVADGCSNANTGRSNSSPSGVKALTHGSVLGCSTEISTFSQPPRSWYQTDNPATSQPDIVKCTNRDSHQRLYQSSSSVEPFFESQDVTITMPQQPALFSTYSTIQHHSAPFFYDLKNCVYGGLRTSWQASTLQHHRASNLLGSKTTAEQQLDPQCIFPSYAFHSEMANPVAQPAASSSFLVPPLFTPTPPPRVFLLPAQPATSSSFSAPLSFTSSPLHRTFLPPTVAALLAGAGPVPCAPPPPSPALHQLLLALAAPPVPPPAAWCRGPPW